MALSGSMALVDFAIEICAKVIKAKDHEIVYVSHHGTIKISRS